MPILARMVLAMASRLGATPHRRRRRRARSKGDPGPRVYDDAPSALEALVADLERLGFDPVVSEGDDDATAVVAFANCPFADLARAHPDLVCGLHRGLVAGFVAEMGDAEVREFCSLAHRTPCQVARHHPLEFDIATIRGGTPVITLTDAAAVKVKELLAAEDAAELALRVAVRPGGCSGFSYEMFFDGDIAADDQQAQYGPDGAVKVVVDPASAQLLDGATLDYKDGLDQSGFAITNPNATRTCGCGQSFS